MLMVSERNMIDQQVSLVHHSSLQYDLIIFTLIFSPTLPRYIPIYSWPNYMFFFFFKLMQQTSLYCLYKSMHRTGH